MRIEGWDLEILINEQQLHEYIISDSVLGVSASGALKSYVVEGTQKKFRDSATFVAVPAAGTHYCIRTSTKNEVVAKIFVDGINDGFFIRGSSHNLSYTLKGFFNRNATMMYNFVFDKSEWVETNIPSRTKFGGLGAISIYFYKIKRIHKSDLDCSPDKIFENVKIPEGKKCVDMDITTKFSEGVEINRSLYNAEIDNDPLAVLHINYRSIDWFIIKRIPINNHTLSTLDIADIKEEVIDTKKDIIGKTSNTKIVKRKYREIIEILDSDEELSSFKKQK